MQEALALARGNVGRALVLAGEAEEAVSYLDGTGASQVRGACRCSCLTLTVSFEGEEAVSFLDVTGVSEVRGACRCSWRYDNPYFFILWRVRVMCFVICALLLCVGMYVLIVRRWEPGRPLSNPPSSFLVTILNMDISQVLFVFSFFLREGCGPSLVVLLFVRHCC